MTVIKQYTGGNWEAILVGEQGPTGPAGPGVPAGGVAGDLLVKNSGTDYDTAWTDAPTVDSLTLDAAAAETLTTVGQTAWNDTAGSPATLLKGGNVTAVMGQTVYQRVTNETGSPLTKGQVVYLSGASGQKPTVQLAQANGDPTSSKTFGVVAESISHNGQGFVITEGLLQGFATNLLTEGALVWLSPTTAGGMTTTKPTAPDHVVMVGICVKSGSGTSGSILVKVQNGYELDELHDVAYTGTPAAGDVLTRSASGLWTNAAPAATGAPTDAQYVTLATNGNLTSERVLTAGTGVTITDAGAGSTVTVATSAILPTIIDAKGDLIVGTANDTAARLAIGDDGTLLTADSTQAGGVKWIGRTGAFVHVRTLAPRSDRGYGLFVSGNTAASTSTACAGPAFTVLKNATLTAVTIESMSSTVNATLVIGLYATNADTTAPTTLIQSFGTVSLASTGNKTISGLSVALTAGVVYRVVTAGGTTLGSVRGLATGTSGIDNGSQQAVLMTTTTSTGVDTSFRGQGYSYVPAVQGTLDASPTWTVTNANLILPNIGVVVS